MKKKLPKKKKKLISKAFKILIGIAEDNRLYIVKKENGITAQCEPINFLDVKSNQMKK
jgi:hypothetical protein